MNSLQAAVTHWADRTFGQAQNPTRVAIRANEEMAELLRKCSYNAPAEEIAEEIADVFIVLMRLCSVLERDIEREVERKMAINETRRWTVDGQGHGHHVRVDRQVLR